MYVTLDISGTYPEPQVSPARKNTYVTLVVYREESYSA